MKQITISAFVASAVLFLFILFFGQQCNKMHDADMARDDSLTITRNREFYMNNKRIEMRTRMVDFTKFYDATKQPRFLDSALRYSDSLNHYKL